MYNKPTMTIYNAEQCCWCNMLLPDALQVDISKGAVVQECRNRCYVLHAWRKQMVSLRSTGVWR